MSFFLSDLNSFGGVLPHTRLHKYGKEDAALTSLFMLGRWPHFRVARDCCPYLWHLFHKKRGWGWTVDGISSKKHWGPNTWNASEPWRVEMPHDGAAVRLLIERELQQQRCRDLRVGIIYP